jgi:hypothetical protein
MGTMLDDTFMDPSDEVIEEPGETPEVETEAAPVSPEPARTPISRRRKAAEAQEATLKAVESLKEELAQERATAREDRERYARESAEMRGQIQGWMSSRPQQEQKREEGPDPDKLFEEANQALDRRDYSTWQKKQADAISARAVRDVMARMPAQQAQQPQVNPMLYGIASQYADVVGNRVAMRAAQNHDLLLAEQGVPEGPERWKKAFEEGKRYLGQGASPQGQSFSSKSRQVLGGRPAGRTAAGGGGKGEPGVTLSKAELDMAKKFRMSADEYAQHLVAMHPDRLEQG